MSARARLAISFTALFGAVVIALSIAAYLLVRNDAYLRLDAALQVATGATAMSGQHELNEHSRRTPGEADLQFVLDEAGSSALTDTQILVREANRNVAYKPGAEHGFDLRTTSPDILTNGATLDGFRIATRSFRAPKFDTVYQIYAAKPVAPALTRLRQLRLGLFVFVPIGLALAGFAGYLLAERSLTPLKELAQTVDAVTSSDLSARVKLSNERDEIGVLGLRFNSLLDRLEQAFKVQRRFMADASHQIRTPVTIALAAAQVTSRDPNASLRDCNDSLGVIAHQMLQLRRTVEDMFFLSQADTASLKLERKEMYLDDAVSDAVRAAKALAREKQQTLNVNNLPEAKCLGDADLLKQAVLILLDNAVKFTPCDGSIEIALFRRSNDWLCSVTDSGPGISEAAQPQIFERFFRENRPGNEAALGAGLGLAIAKSIVEGHNGSITLVESRPGRTTFEIAIPVLEHDTGPNAIQANSLAVRM
ncbi:MAG TPA: ATP-binding protein [Bryobacteraceae bacterium]|jgi:signal transduction histidine kinase|nr:ATP-binding protein [Bryobacteraceae bacterium]